MSFEGDFTNTGRRSEVNDFVKFLKKLKIPKKIVISGNHDLTLEEDKYLTELGPKVFLRNLFSFQNSIISSKMVNWCMILKKLKK